MSAKPNKLVVRITENQLRWLTDVLIKEQRTKSQVIREALNLYLIEKNKRYASNEPSKLQPKTKK